MLQNDLAIFRLQLKIALKNKIVFFYTLIIPIIMLFLNRGANFRDGYVLYLYWSYIVVTTILNGFMMSLIQLRETGFLKTLSYTVGSKLSVILSSFLVQLLIIQIEIFLFNLVVLFLITPISPVTFLYGFLVTFLSSIVCTSMLSVLFLLKIKERTFNVVINIFLFVDIFLLGMHPTGVWNYLLTIVNPFQLVYELYAIPATIDTFTITLGSVTTIYLLMGFFILNRVSESVKYLV